MVSSMNLAFDINAEVANLQKLLDGVSTPINADLKTDLANTGLDGNIILGDVIGLDLKANASVANLQALADSWKWNFPAQKLLDRLV